MIKAIFADFVYHLKKVLSVFRYISFVLIPKPFRAIIFVFTLFNRALDHVIDKLTWKN
jgi:phytoene/squalene synthetase